MKCPSCSSALVGKKLTDFEVDFCERGCSGVWLDRDELLRIDEQHEFPAAEFLSITKDARGDALTETPRICPKCSGEVLVKQFVDIQHRIEIDQCWKCGGIWFDPGELRELREQYRTVEDRAAAVNAYVQDHLNQAKASLSAEVAEQLERYRKEMEGPLSAFIAGFRRLVQDPDPTDAL